MDKSSLTVGLISVYVYMLMVALLLYALIDTYKLDITLATNLLIWSATLFAPIAVYYGIKSWKVQRFEEHKIKAITEIRECLLRFNGVILKYRLNGDNYELLKNNSEQFTQKQKEFIMTVEDLRSQITFIADHNSVYFGDINEIYKHNNRLLDIVIKLDESADDVLYCLLGSAKLVGGDDPEEEQDVKLDKRLYLIDLKSDELRFMRDKELQQKCEAYEKTHISKPIKEFYKLLDDMLLKSYRF